MLSVRLRWSVVLGVAYGILFFHALPFALCALRIQSSIPDLIDHKAGHDLGIEIGGFPGHDEAGI